MKLRIHNDTLRVRLTQSEVARLATGQRIEQITSFSATSRLVSSIEPVASIVEVQAAFDGSQVAVRVPTIRIIQWAQSDEVGIEASQAIDATRSLQILIEKDFKCLHGSDVSENEDAFPNPRAG